MWVDKHFFNWLPEGWRGCADVFLKVPWAWCSPCPSGLLPYGMSLIRLPHDGVEGCKSYQNHNSISIKDSCMYQYITEGTVRMVNSVNFSKLFYVSLYLLAGVSDGYDLVQTSEPFFRWTTHSGASYLCEGLPISFLIEENHTLRRNLIWK